MAQSFREIVRDDESLIHLLNLIDKKAISENGEIRIGDFEGTCAKITTINTKNPHEYTRRIAWTLTGRLLLGLTTYHHIQVRICLEESRQLLSRCSGGLFDVKTSKTTKRKTKQVITKTKRKKTHTTEVDEEVTETESVCFWEEPLVLDKSDITALPDKTLVPASKVTLREINESSIPHFTDIDQSLVSGFGDHGVNVFEDEDEEMESIVDFDQSDSVNTPTFDAPIDLDENMNNVNVPDIDQMSYSSRSELVALVPEPIAVPTQKPSVREKENPLSLLAAMMPLKPLAVTTWRKREGKRRSSIFKDDEKIIPVWEMKKRASNDFLHCKNRKSNLMTQDKLLRRRTVDIFSKPVMNGTINRHWFKLTARTQQSDTDWTTIQDAFDSGNYDESNQTNGSVASCEIDILRNESETRIQSLQTCSRNVSHISDSVPMQPVLTSTPIRETSWQQSVISFHAPRSQTNPINPPSAFEDSLPPPPQEFQNSNQSHFVRCSHNQSIPHLYATNVPEIDLKIELNESPQIVHSDLAALLGKNSLEYTIMQKLMKLWQKNTHPIIVGHLLTPHCNRFHAAKTFASLLSLKKKKLVQLENSDDGKIIHVSTGECLASIAV